MWMLYSGWAGSHGSSSSATPTTNVPTPSKRTSSLLSGQGSSTAIGGGTNKAEDADDECGDESNGESKNTYVILKHEVYACGIFFLLTTLCQLGLQQNLLQGRNIGLSD